MSSGSSAQIMAFEDTWTWGNDDEAVLEELTRLHGRLAEFMDYTVRVLGKNSLAAYLVMMSVRLLELHWVLKPTGSICTVTLRLATILCLSLTLSLGRNTLGMRLSGNARMQKDLHLPGWPEGQLQLEANPMPILTSVSFNPQLARRPTATRLNIFLIQPLSKFQSSVGPKANCNQAHTTPD